MPEIPNAFRYEPDKRALKLWLFTRKEDKKWGSDDIYGFFVTNDYAQDQGFFIAAITLEIVGVMLLIVNGFSLGDNQFALLAAIVAFGLFIGDVFLAYLLHRNHEKKCFAINEVRVSEDPSQKAILDDAIRKGSFLNIILILGIIFIATFKFFGIVLLGTYDHIGIYITLLIMFSFIVYAHIKHTGYFIYGWRTKKLFKKQLSLLNRGDNKYLAGDWGHYFESDINLLEGKDEIIANQCHKIKVAERKPDKCKYAYDIVSKGILSDSDITSFIQRPSITKDQITTIQRECRKMQMRQYETKT